MPRPARVRTDKTAASNCSLIFNSPPPNCGCLDFPVKLLHKQPTGLLAREGRRNRDPNHWNGTGVAVTAFDMTPPTADQRRQITTGLSDEERHVLLQHGTEAAFCGVFLDNKKEGIYTCRFCGLLFV